MSDVRRTPWIRFSVDSIDYALPLDLVSEVVPPPRLRLIPFVPKGRAGVINVKGEPLPAVNGGAVLQGRPTVVHRHVLILEHGDFRFGMFVDEVSRIEWGVGSNAQKTASGVEDEMSGANFVRWDFSVGKRVGFVDPDALIRCVSDAFLNPTSITRKMGDNSCRNAF